MSFFPNVFVTDPNTPANQAAVSSAGALKTDASATTQPVSAAALPLPTGAATAAKQPAIGVAGTSSTDVTTVQGIAGATPVIVSGTVTATNASISLNNTTASLSSTQIGGVYNSITPTMASGQMAPVQLDLNGNQKVNLINTSIAITATALPLPTGAATSALQTTSNTSLATIATNTPTVGQKTMAGSVPVAIASDQGDLGVNIDKYGGTATTLGSKVSASSMPVVIASDQADVPINIDKVGNTAITLGQKMASSSFPVTLASDNGISQAAISPGTTSAPSAAIVVAGKTADGTPAYDPIPLIAGGTALSVSQTTATPAGTNVIGAVGIQASATGGYTPYFANAIKATVTTVSTAAGKFGAAALINTDAAPVYLQCFDVASGTTVTLGTTVPTFVIPYPANSTAANGVSDRFELAVGANLANGLKIAATTTPTGAGASTNGLTGSIFYK